MSDDELNLNPQDVRGTAEQLAGVSTQIQDVMSALQAKLGSYGPARWGDDSIGHGFADGDQGYVAQAKSRDDSASAVAGLLGTYGGQLGDAADSLEQQDQQQ